MRLVWMMILTLGCDTKKPEADWDTGGSYSGWSDDNHADHDGGDDDGGDTSADTDGGENGGEETGGDDGGSWSASCQFGSNICIETTNPDPGAWCDYEGGSSNETACGADYTSRCEIPASADWGDTYAYAAIAYYYNGFDGSAACEDIGGTFTAFDGGD